MILASDITLGYEKQNNIIENGNFNIKRGEFIFIGGPSGSGKSTLLKSLHGEVKLKTGMMIVNSFNLKNANNNKIQDLRKSIGIVFQDYKLIQNCTIEENVMLPLRINGYGDELSYKQALKLLSHVKLSHRVGYYPAQLSGGEQQRVAVARALAHNPKIILADEPTGNLDDFSASLVWGLLKGANEQLGVTVVVVTHQIPSNFGIHFRQFSIDDKVIYEVS